MSYIFLPHPQIFFNLPTSRPEQLFAKGWIAKDQTELEKAVVEFRAIASQITSNKKPAFSDAHLHDLDTRPAIAVIADGATLHTNILNGEQKHLQDLDGKKAFQLGKEIAEKKWRVILPGYTGLCQNVIEGVREGGGQYIVVTTRRSLNYDEAGNPVLPQDSKHGFYIITNTLAESKSALFALSDHSVYLPGGLGTYDLFSDHFVLEQTSAYRDYRLLNYHRRYPIVLNDDGFWQPFIKMTQHMVAEGFAAKEHNSIIKDAKSVEGVIARLRNNLYPGRPWPTLSNGNSHLFIPSAAITLASELSRGSVVRQIIAVEPDRLTQMLRHARQPIAETEITNPILRSAFDRTVTAVYCGSRDGKNTIHLEAARATGRLCKENGETIIYGGSRFGLMGAVADSAIGTPILAVTPISFLTNQSNAANEGFHEGITLTIAVPGMQERKMLMTCLASHAAGDKSYILSGGIGTYDETSEEHRLIVTRVIDKRLDVIDVNRYWSSCLPQLYDEPMRRGYIAKGPSPIHYNTYTRA